MGQLAHRLEELEWETTGSPSYVVPAASPTDGQLDPTGIHLFRHPIWGVVLTIDGEQSAGHHPASWLGVKVVRAFPLSNPAVNIAFLNQKSEEIGMIPNLSVLDAQAAEITETELEQRYLSACILRIRSIRWEGDTMYWHVDTNRGEREFVVRANRETLLSLGPNRVLVIDVDGNRFEIEDDQRLDKASRAILDEAL